MIWSLVWIYWLLWMPLYSEAQCSERVILRHAITLNLWLNSVMQSLQYLSTSQMTSPFVNIAEWIVSHSYRYRKMLTGSLIQSLLCEKECMQVCTYNFTLSKQHVLCITFNFSLSKQHILCITFNFTLSKQHILCITNNFTLRKQHILCITNSTIFFNKL